PCVSHAVHATKSLPAGFYSKLAQAEGPHLPGPSRPKALQALPSEPGTVRMRPPDLLQHLDQSARAAHASSQTPAHTGPQPNATSSVQLKGQHSSSHHLSHVAEAKAGQPLRLQRCGSQSSSPPQTPCQPSLHSPHSQAHQAAKHSQPPAQPQLPVEARGLHGEHAPAEQESPQGSPKASPKASQPRLPPHPELTERDHDLLQQLHDRHAKAQSKASRSKSPHRGDRGSLSPKAHGLPSSPSEAELHDPTAAAVAAAVEDHGGPRSEWPELEPDALQNEVAAREVELRVLRQELEARSQEVLRLENKIRDTEDQLREATGHVGTLSAKVESAAGSKQAVLQASAKHIDSQVAMLKKRLASAEWELAEKDDELSGLQEAIHHGTQQVAAKATELQAMQHQQKLQGSKVAKLQKDSSLLHRHMAIDHWRHNVEALVEQEQQDAVMIRERREHQRQIDVFREEILTLQSYLSRMDEKSKYHAEEIERRKELLKALVMEERLCVAAARLGHETADELKRGQMEEQRILEARLQEEMGRRSSLSAQAKTYEEVEANARQWQEQLAALTACVRDAAKAMRDHGPHVAKTAVDDAVESFIQKMRHQGELVPPIVRVSSSAHHVAEHTVSLELTHAALVHGLPPAWMRTDRLQHTQHTQHMQHIQHIQCIQHIQLTQRVQLIQITHAMQHMCHERSQRAHTKRQLLTRHTRRIQPRQATRSKRQARRSQLITCTQLISMMRNLSCYILLAPGAADGLADQIRSIIQAELADRVAELDRRERCLVEREESLKQREQAFAAAETPTPARALFQVHPEAESGDLNSVSSKAPKPAGYARPVRGAGTIPRAQAKLFQAAQPEDCGDASEEPKERLQQKAPAVSALFQAVEAVEAVEDVAPISKVHPVSSSSTVAPSGRMPEPPSLFAETPAPQSEILTTSAGTASELKDRFEQKAGPSSKTAEQRRASSQERGMRQHRHSAPAFQAPAEAAARSSAEFSEVSAGTANELKDIFEQRAQQARRDSDTPEQKGSWKPVLLSDVHVWTGFLRSV
ncbi:GIP, partial [Symbiodinium pilosum]